MIPTASDFKKALELILESGRSEKKDYVDILSKELHQHVGGYSSSNHRMPICCTVMRQMMKSSDLVLSSPLKGKGANLKIRYFL